MPKGIPHGRSCAGSRPCVFSPCCAGLRGGGPQPGQHGHLLRCARPAVGLRPCEASQAGGVAAAARPGWLGRAWACAGTATLPTSPGRRGRSLPAVLPPQNITACPPNQHRKALFPSFQVVDLLIKLYKFPNFSISRALLHGTRSAGGAPPGSPAAPRPGSAGSASVAASQPSRSGPSASGDSKHDVPIGGRKRPGRVPGPGGGWCALQVEPGARLLSSSRGCVLH